MVVAISLQVLLGQSASTASVWDGVYTAEQSARGAEAYKADCASCHGYDLSGGGQAPALADRDFMANWKGTALSELFERVQVTMPADRPGELTRERTADILAFLLNANKFPAGTAELPASLDVLKTIRFEGERGAR